VGRRKIAKKIAKNKRHYPLGHLRRGVDQSQRYG
jgi:hypothetical protein